jgi:hypothetical protein
MKRAPIRKNRRVIAVALTWDGARWPIRSLPPKVRAFLGDSARKSGSFRIGDPARLFARDDIHEIRVCWVPRLKGGDDVLAAPFPAPGNKRIAFQAVRRVRLGDYFGVVYRRRNC